MFVYHGYECLINRRLCKALSLLSLIIKSYIYTAFCSCFQLSCFVSECPKLEVGSRKLEDGNRKSEVGSRKSEVRSPKLQVGNPKSEVGTEVGIRKSEVGSQKSEVGSRKSEVRSRKPEFGSRKFLFCFRRKRNLWLSSAKCQLNIS